MADVVISDDSAEQQAADFAEGLAVGVALTEAQEAQETASEAAAVSEVAAAVSVDASDRVTMLEAQIAALQAELQTLGEAMYLLASDEAELADEIGAVEAEAHMAAVDATIAEQEASDVTEIVEAEAEAHESGRNASGSESGETPPQAAEQPNETGQSGRNERAGKPRFRRGR